MGGINPKRLRHLLSDGDIVGAMCTAAARFQQLSG